MDIISDLLQPYRDQIGSVAGIVTIFQLLSGSVVCNDIRRKKSTKGFSIIPFLGGFVLSVLSMKFGSLIQDDAMIRINAIGLILSIAYISYFYLSTPPKQKSVVLYQCIYALAFAVGVLVYTGWEQKHLVEYRLGLIITGFLITLVASPFLGLRDIIRKKSTEGLPLPMIASGTLVAFMWMLYGFCLNNGVVVVQNLIVLVLSSIQLSLFVIYPSVPVTVAKKSKKAGNKKNE